MDEGGRRHILRYEGVFRSSPDINAPRDKEVLVMHIAASEFAFSSLLMTYRDGV